MKNVQLNYFPDEYDILSKRRRYRLIVIVCIFALFLFLDCAYWFKFSDGYCRIADENGNLQIGWGYVSESEANMYHKSASHIGLQFPQIFNLNKQNINSPCSQLTTFHCFSDDAGISHGPWAGPSKGWVSYTFLGMGFFSLVDKPSSRLTGGYKASTPYEIHHTTISIPTWMILILPFYRTLREKRM